jgi:uncharacterized membrane protein YfcA
MLALAAVCAAAFAASGLTLFSGFGLGTLLMPVFALFFGVETAVGLTAVVHFLNNLFKLVLLSRRADRAVVLRFGVPAVLAAFAGARALALLSRLPPLAGYEAFGEPREITAVKLSLGALMLAFAALEAWPAAAAVSFDRRYLPLGGALSGFFGGLSGHQGALRSAFLVRSGLSKEGFVATGVVIACMVDATRMAVYATGFPLDSLRAHGGILAAATASAFLGVLAGRLLLEKVTIVSVQRAVAGMLALIGLGLAAGLI